MILLQADVLLNSLVSGEHIEGTPSTTFFSMQYKVLFSVFTFAGMMTSTVTAAAVEKRSCAPYGRQFCCAVEETPDQEILPNRMFTLSELFLAE